MRGEAHMLSDVRPGAGQAAGKGCMLGTNSDRVPVWRSKE
ncbi:hypothetical protein BN2537_885 [Streptomyces venezuelae]|nr:hypothetical protein BN2537_885 [Streptomyces venezuelae]